MCDFTPEMPQGWTPEDARMFAAEQTDGDLALLIAAVLRARDEHVAQQRFHAGQAERYNDWLRVACEVRDACLMALREATDAALPAIVTRMTPDELTAWDPDE